MHSDPESIASEAFVDRHIGPSEEEIAAMLAELGLASLDELVERTVPESIRSSAELALPPALGEAEQLARLRAIAAKNQVFRSYIGAGYYDCVTPTVIQRNILENPGWYTQYTPYQAEIAQGRLEALLNFQTLVADLTGLPFSNASLLDEATAAAEAMTMCHHASRKLKRRFFVADDCHPQVRAVVRTRAEPAGIEIVEAPADQVDFADPELFGVLVAYPATDGRIRDYRSLAERARQADVRVVMTTDLLALTLLTPPGELGADIAVGSSQRFGVPLGYGGPHAAFIATRDAYKRLIPGRIVGVSLDSHGQVAYRLALQTREQHIRRDRATSNICTAQVLLAVIASMYAVYHGPRGLSRIARRVRALTAALARGLVHLGFELPPGPHFDTLTVPVAEPERRRIIERARASAINLREDLTGRLGVSLDETTRLEDVRELLAIFAVARPSATPPAVEHTSAEELPAPFARTSAFLEHPVFNSYHAEHELLRYMRRLESRDLSLTTSMIPLGSCTMKLNGTAEMLPITWPEFSRLHPFAPREQALGYAEVFSDLERWLAEITGMSAVSLQPNAGAQGEYAGLLAIRAYHRERGEAHRNVCLIPTSAHGTNPATAVMAGMRVISVACDAAGNVDVADLEAKADAHGRELGALMLTYPSTHGVFEEKVREICSIVHARGGLVYLDGANMNAQVGLCRPGDYGADVCHLNLHKTFCIPHGGGGPGMGPIAVNARLAPFLPGHPALAEGPRVNGPVSAAPYGSANILLISWAYIAMMGAAGLRKATQVAILNANYMAKRLEPHYPVLFRGSRGAVAHEFIIDLSAHKKLAGIEVDDVAKRLMDCGYHAPTMSFPVPGTLMIEPTESESKAELDRFCDALIVIRDELAQIAQGKLDRRDNPLKNAPHTAAALLTAEWRHPYSRERAAYPTAWTREHKYWPPVGRIDNARGDRQLVSTLQTDLEAALRLPLSERG